MTSTPTPPEQADLHRRIGQLESRLRRQRRIFLGAGLIAAACAGIAAGPIGEAMGLLRVERVQARSIDVVNEAGAVVGTFDAGPGGGRIVLMDNEGSPQLELGPSEPGGYAVRVAQREARGWGWIGGDRPEPARRAAEREEVPERAFGAELLRKGIDASPSDRELAVALIQAGWVYVMPSPRSPSAAWGKTDGRATWNRGYWVNASRGTFSKSQPESGDGFAGDGIDHRGWDRRGTYPEPSAIEWLCSKSGGPPAEDAAEEAAAQEDAPGDG